MVTGFARILGERFSCLVLHFPLNSHRAFGAQVGNFQHLPATTIGVHAKRLGTEVPPLVSAGFRQCLHFADPRLYSDEFGVGRQGPWERSPSLY